MTFVVFLLSFPNESAPPTRLKVFDVSVITDCFFGVDGTVLPEFFSALSRGTEVPPDLLLGVRYT